MRVVSSFCAIAALAAGVDAAVNRKKQSTLSRVLGPVVKTGGLAAALMGIPTGAAARTEVHHAYYQTRGDLQSLLEGSCAGSAIEATPGCAMEDRFRSWALESSKKYVTSETAVNGDEEEIVIIKPTPGQEDEYQSRYKAYASNVALAEQFNEQSQGAATFGITAFMDMPEEEFLKQRTGLAWTPEAQAEHAALPEYQPEPVFGMFLGQEPASKKDWCADGYCTAIKDQGQCGSCWAFSTVEQVESEAIKAGIKDASGNPYTLSPQELVSCDHKGDMGCGGGLPIHALKWLEKKGLEQEKDYPYKSGILGKNYKCHHLKKSKEEVKVTSFSQIAGGAEDEDKLKDHVLKRGPVSVGVDANAKWQMYKGGVLQAEDCAGPLDHAVQVVGWDDDAGEIKVRNSWAEIWGEDGYIRLKAGTNTCGVANMAVVASVAKVKAGGDDITIDV